MAEVLEGHALESNVLERIAAKYVWWQPPAATLARPRYFLCQLMTLGTEDDVNTVRDTWGDDAFVDALEHAQPGVMDPKSWNYWHRYYGKTVPPMPERPLP